MRLDNRNYENEILNKKIYEKFPRNKCQKN